MEEEILDELLVGEGYLVRPETENVFIADSSSDCQQFVEEASLGLLALGEEKIVLEDSGLTLLNEENLQPLGIQGEAAVIANDDPVGDELSVGKAPIIINEAEVHSLTIVEPKTVGPHVVETVESLMSKKPIRVLDVDVTSEEYRRYFWRSYLFNSFSYVTDKRQHAFVYLRWYHMVMLMIRELIDVHKVEPEDIPKKTLYFYKAIPVNPGAKKIIHDRIASDINHMKPMELKHKYVFNAESVRDIVIEKCIRIKDQSLPHFIELCSSSYIEDSISRVQHDNPVFEMALSIQNNYDPFDPLFLEKAALFLRTSRFECFLIEECRLIVQDYVDIVSSRVEAGVSLFYAKKFPVRLWQKRLLSDKSEPSLNYYECLHFCKNKLKRRYGTIKWPNPLSEVLDWGWYECTSLASHSVRSDSLDSPHPDIEFRPVTVGSLRGPPQPVVIAPMSENASGGSPIGAYTPSERKLKIARWREKRARRNFNTRTVTYQVRADLANIRPRENGRFLPKV